MNKLLNLQKTLLMMLVMLLATILNLYSQCTLPAVPATSNAISVTCTGFTVSWSTVTGATGYRLDVSNSPEFETFVGIYNNLTVTTLSKAVTGLATGTYYYRVRAVNSCGPSPSSVKKSVMVGSNGGITISELSQTNQAYICDDKFGETTVSGYIGSILRWEVSSDNINWTSIGYPGAITIPPASISITGNESRIRAIIKKNGCTEVPSASTAYFRIPKPAGPVLDIVSGISCSWLTLNWQPIPEVTQYLLDVATDEDFTDKVTGYDGLLIEDVTQLIEGLSGSTQYYYRVSGIASCGTTEYSIGQTRTPAMPSAGFSYGSNSFCNWNMSNNPLLQVFNPKPIFSNGGVAGTFSSSPEGLALNSVTGEINIQASVAGTYTISNTVESNIGCGTAINETQITIMGGMSLTIEEIPFAALSQRAYYRIKEADTDPSLRDKTQYQIKWTHIGSDGQLRASTDEITPWESIGKSQFAYFVNNDPATGTPRTADALCVDVINKATGCLTRKCVGANPAVLPAPGSTFREENAEIPAKQEDNVKLYPNPATNTLNIELQTEGQATIQLRNLNGLLVKEVKSQGRTVTMDVSHLSTGLYLVHILKDKKVIRRKVEVVR